MLEQTPSVLEGSDERPVVAVFDFDGTLTRRDSLLPFLWHVSSPGAFVWNAAVLLPTLLRYALGLMDSGPAKERVLGQFLEGRSVNEVQSAAKRFAKEQIPTLLDANAIERFRWHKRQGHTTVLVSASPELYLRSWGKTEEIDLVIGTRLETDEGVFTGRFDTPNCYGPEKVNRLEARLGPLGSFRLHVYGDSAGDGPLLDVADRSYYRTFESEESDRDESNGDEGQWMTKMLWSLAGAAVIYFGIVLWSGASELRTALQRLPWWLLLVLPLVVFGGYVLRFLRWHWYLHRLGYFVPSGDSFRIFMASLALTATPGKAGESVKSLLLKRDYDIPATPTLAGLFAERFTDLFSVVIVILLGLLSLPQGQMLVIGVGIVQLAAFGLLQRPTWIERFILPLLRRWPILHRWADRAQTMLESAHTLFRPSTFLVGLLIGSLPWLAEGAVLYVIYQALGAETILLYEAFLIHAASMLLGALTFMPGGLGGYEAASIALAIAYGASRPTAAAATLLVRVLTLWFAVGIGIIALNRILFISNKNG